MAAVRLITVVGLGVDACAHLDLASTYSEAAGPISEGVLFRAEAVLALLTALALILSARRLSFLAGILLLTIRPGRRLAGPAPGASGHRGGRIPPGR
jgi:hypothetical protein